MDPFESIGTTNAEGRNAVIEVEVFTGLTASSTVSTLTRTDPGGGGGLVACVVGGVVFFGLHNWFGSGVR